MEKHWITPVTGCAPEGSLAAGPWAGLPDAGDAADPSRSPVERDLGADICRWADDIDVEVARLLDECGPESPPASFGADDAPDTGLAALAAMCGLNGLGGDAVSALFGQDQAADVLSAGPVLCALTEQAVSDLASLSDDQLTGALSAARRLENRAAYLRTVAIAEFARRREVEREEAKSRKVPLHCRPGQFPGEELQGRDPLNQLTTPPDREADAPAAPATSEGWQDDPGYRDEDRGSNLPVQPGSEVQTSPPVQASRRLDGRAASARRYALDRPLRPHVHHHAHPVRPLALTQFHL
jgi:hypothetical protein